MHCTSIALEPSTWYLSGTLNSTVTQVSGTVAVRYHHPSVILSRGGGGGPAVGGGQVVMARRTHALPGAHAIRIDPGGYTCCPKLSADFCGHPQVRSGQVRSGQVTSGQVRSGQVGPLWFCNALPDMHNVAYLVLARSHLPHDVAYLVLAHSHLTHDVAFIWCWHTVTLYRPWRTTPLADIAQYLQDS